MTRAASLVMLMGLAGGCTGTIDVDEGGAGDVPGAETPPEAGGPDGGLPVDDGCAAGVDAADREVWFTDGGNGAGDLAIEDRLVALIEGAEDGARVRAAFGYLDQVRVARALVEASRRGVDVRLVIDERNQVQKPDGSWVWNDAVEQARAELGQRLIVCGGGDTPADGGGCIGSEKNHNSFLLVSSLCDGTESIVAQTSAYPTKSQAFARNNLVVLRGDAGLHAAYETYWEDLARRRRDADYYRIENGETGTRLFLYPRAAEGTSSVEPATDTVFRLLRDNVSCQGGTRVRLAMTYWSSGRDYLADELGRLAGLGCKVDVVVRAGTVDAAVLSTLRSRLGADHVRQLAGVHHKFLLVEGQYSGQPAALVWTGTQDFTHPALRRNDEVLLRIDDAAVHDAFRVEHEAMFAAGAE